ncbi:uncharacterized protein PRCAT00000768001 [Priceomyces carsonii]|uniref:uncharacterized protein n=1 Tax=Priceomyces carsonii TaxID=28549 RepID=UPI002EDA6A17|nr:unnamed protein product [Priceomyces carsonii]
MLLDSSGFGSLNITESIQNNDTYRPSTRIARYQVIIALALGLFAFFTFTILKVRYPKIYVANLNSLNLDPTPLLSRRNLPKLPPTSLFGWIPILFRITEDEILQHAGLDAVVFLGFFNMCIKLLGTCMVFAVAIISPIRYKYTGRVDQDYPSVNETVWNEDGDVTLLKNKHTSNQFLWLYIIFTHIFTFITVYFLFKQTSKIIKIRQDYLGKQNSITDRTIKISGIPPFLRDEVDLKRQIESLDIGEIESVVIVKEWNNLNHLFKLRRKLLRAIEVSWVECFKINGVKKTDLLFSNLSSTLGDSINMNRTPRYSDNPRGAHQQQNPGLSDEESGHRSSPVPNSDIFQNDESASSSSSSSSSGGNGNSELVEESVGELPLLDDQLNSRPKIRDGFLGILGKKVDAINYWNEQLEIINKEITKARTREYPPTSSAFVTMKSVAQAQMVAQAVLDPKVNHLITNLAPAPHDVIWDNLCLTRRERNIRIFFVTLAIGIISVLLVYPVRYLANFLNVKSISKVWPSLGDFLKRNKWAQALVTGLVPYIFTIFNNVMPHLYIWISKKQGYTSHSDEELSSVSKNFFYIFVNLFLIFTVFGTVSLSDTTKIASQLAKSLRDLSLFYVDFIILQGLGIFPYKLLLLGNLFKFLLGSLFWCKTPRDYLRLYKPPVFNFGLQLPQPILILIITMVYSLMSTRILTAGLIYFMIGYFVYKYQLLYACVHPPHSTGRVWPLVFRRVILGLLLFQLTMVGTLALQKDYIYASSLVPLLLLSVGCLWNFEKNYIPLSIFIALRSIEKNNRLPENDEETIIQTEEQSLTLDERRESNQTYEYPHLLDSLDGALIAVDQNDALVVNSDGLAIRKTKTIDVWD